MARGKVQFPHKTNGTTTKLRTSSSSTNETVSDGGSPIRTKDVKVNGHKLEPAPQNEYEKKKQTFITRAVWTLAMIGGFFLAMFSGHVYMLFVITAIQIISFKEVINIAQVPTKKKNLPLTRSLNWYFLAITMYFFYGESVIYYFKHILLVDKVLLPFATHHRFISFMMYIMGESCCEECDIELTQLQVSSSSLLPSRKVTTNSSSLNLPGRIWHCSLSSYRPTSP